jgi:hypothetical protein
MKIKIAVLFFLLMMAALDIFAQSPPPTGYVTPSALTVKASNGQMFYLQRDSSGNLFTTSAGGSLFNLGQPNPTGYVQPVAIVAQDSSGNWHFLQVDSNGNLMTTGSSSGGGTSVTVNGGSALMNLNLNGTSPSPDSGFIACSLKISNPNSIIECPFGTTSTTFLAGNATASAAAGVVESFTVGTGGVTANSLVQNDTSNPAKIVNATTGVYGVALSTVAATGTVNVQRNGVVSCVTDTGGATAGHVVVIGTGTVIDCKDSGQTASSAIPISTRIVGVFLTSASGGSTAQVELTPAHFGTQVSGNSGRIATAGANIGTATAGSEACADGSGNVDTAGCGVTNLPYYLPPVGVNGQTGTSYSFQDSDNGKLVTVNNTAAVAVTLPQANSGAQLFGTVNNPGTNSCSGTNTCTTGAVTITAARMILGVIEWNAGGYTMTTMTDSKGDSCSLAGAGNNQVGSSSPHFASFYCPNAIGGSTTFTFNWTGAGALSTTPHILQYSNITNVSPLDQQTFANGTSGVPNSGSVTTTQAVELVVSVSPNLSCGSTATSDYTNRVTTNMQFNGFIADKVVNTIGAYSATANGTCTNWGSQILTFKTTGVTATFATGWRACFQNLGTGVATITPTTSLLNGVTSLSFPQNGGACVWSDGANYEANTFGTGTVFNAAANGCMADNGTTDNSTCFGALNTSAAVVGGTIYFPYSGTASNTYGFNSAPATVSGNNVRIECAPGVILKQTTATTLFTVTGTNDVVRGCILDGASTGTVAVTVTGASAINDTVEDNIVQNWTSTGTDAWIVSKQSDGLHIHRNKLITGLTASSGIALYSVTGNISRAWITENEVVAVEGTTANVGGIEIISGAGGSVSDVFVRNNDVTWSGTGASSSGFFDSLSANSLVKVFWQNNSCKMTAAAQNCYHIYGDQNGIISGNFADDGTFVSSSPVLDIGDIGNTPVTGNVARNQATTSGGCIRVIDGSTTPGALGNESISDNSCDTPGTGNLAVGIDVTLSASSLTSTTIANNRVHLLRNGTIGIRVNAIAAQDNGDSSVANNGVDSTGGTTQTGIQIKSNALVAGTTSASHVILIGNNVKGVATGIDIEAAAATSGSAVAHTDGTNITGDTCNTVTTCVNIGVSTTIAGSTATVSNTKISDLVIDGATTGISTSITSSTGTSTLSGTQINDVKFNSVTTPYSFATATLLSDSSGIAFANIPANLANGSQVYLSDGTIGSVCAGSGNGAILNQLNGVHVCSPTPATLLVSGILDGEVPITITTTASCTLGTTSGCNATAYNSGYTFNEDATAAAAITYTLPTAAAGKQYCVKNAYNGSAANTGTLELLTSASGQFIIYTDGTLSASGGFVQSAGAAADAACVVGVDSTHWILYVQGGSWSKH